MRLEILGASYSNTKINTTPRAAMPCSTPQHDATSQQQPLPVISVNDVVIDEKKLGAELQYHPSENFDQALHDAAYALVVRELLLQKAQSLGIEFSDNEASQEAAIETLMRHEVECPQIDAANDEVLCRTYYDANPDKLSSPAIIEACHILLAASPEEVEERANIKTQAQDLIAQLKQAPAQFEDFAKQFSACPSKGSGGNLGQLSKGQTTPEFERQLFTLEEGIFEQPIESRYGFHVVRVDRKVEGETLPYDAVKEKIATYLNASVERKSISTYIRRLFTESKISGINLSIDPESLEIS